MELKQMILLSYQIACFYVCVLILTLATAQNTTKGANVIKPGCTNQCGNVTVPYPFGIGSGCAFDSGFEIHCNNSEKPLIGNHLTVYDISDAELRISNVFGWRCYNSTGAVINEDMVSRNFLESSPYSFSALNRFIVVGCDDYGAISGPNNFEYGCSVSCTSREDVMKGGECMGKGCCQKQIPKGLKYYSTTMSSTRNHTDVWSFNSCGYAFLGEADRFHFQGLPDLGDDLTVDYFYERLKATVPIVLEWAIGNLSCVQALERLDDYACRENSHCVDSDTGVGGYRCSCNTGYHGNPYLNQGCQDIDECADPSTNS
ncbi:wall-associated receptor kinase 2-like [Solanum tuberosum]|nr:PREDICTED: wall-associated receptor kinase 2-like [Solanum tuberosum]